MKVIIDIPYKTYKRATRNGICGIATDVERVILDGEVIDGMTNKEIMCSLYPDKILEVSEDRETFDHLSKVSLLVPKQTVEWWNAPYKKEAE